MMIEKQIRNIKFEASAELIRHDATREPFLRTLAAKHNVRFTSNGVAVAYQWQSCDVYYLRAGIFKKHIVVGVCRDSVYLEDPNYVDLAKEIEAYVVKHEQTRLRLVHLSIYGKSEEKT